MAETIGQNSGQDSAAAQSDGSQADESMTLDAPPAGETVTLPVGTAKQLELQFDPKVVQVAARDGDLVFEFPNGGQLALKDFDEDDGEAPQLLLPDGSAVSGEALLNQLAPLLPPPLETTAGPQQSGSPQSGGGGTSVYQSNLGSLIDGLRSAAAEGGVGGGPEGIGDAGVSTPGFGPLALGDDEDLPELPVQTVSTQPAQAQAAIFVPPENPVGPGANQALFAKKADSIDLNAIDVGGYSDGTQYDAGKGNDVVILPGTAREALEAGFTEGSAFNAGKGNDQVTGGSLADLVDGAQGNDTLLGGAGDDSLFGAQGNDSLDGGADNDLLNGGSGRDLLIGGEGDDSLTGAGGRDTLEGGDGLDLLIGGSGNDSLLGGGDNDQLFGENGRDTLDGGLGNDLLNGGGSNDLLLGGIGDDTLTGGSGRDTLDGGLGDDVMTGGNGRDVFSFSLATDQGDDVILDFKTGNGGDRLELADLLDENGDNSIDFADLDAGGHTVAGSADSVVITFAQGGNVTLEGIDGSGVDSFADLLDIKVNVDIS
ncbi:calcium-binding protein [Pelagibius sp.]|uniref:calcium-binding protein n=1 Tax=Pelagibius sp. TaxID=1931238 RepID=UPI003B507E49